MPGITGGWVPPTSGGGTAGDHHLLTNLTTNDDHTNYLNNTRGDARYTQRSANLSDLANTATAAANLGLGASGQHADSFFLQTSNNLSEVPNKLTARTNLGVAIGTDVQAADPTLTALAAISTSADKLIYATGSDTFTTTTFTAAGRALVDDADNTAQRTTLGLGNSATRSVGTTSGDVAAGDAPTTAANLAVTNHVAAATPHVGTKIGYTPFGTLTATDVSSAINQEESRVSQIVATLGAGYQDGYSSLAVRLDAMQAQIDAALQGPPPVTPGIYLRTEDIAKASANLWAGFLGTNTTNLQWTTFNNSSGTNGGAALGHGGLGSTRTDGGTPSTYTWPTDWINGDFLTSQSPRELLRVDQRGNFAANDLDNPLPAGWPDAADGDAHPRAVDRLRVPSSWGTSTTWDGVSIRGSAGTDVYIHDKVRTGAWSQNGNYGGTSILPNGDYSMVDDARYAFISAYQGCVLIYDDPTNGPYNLVQGQALIDSAIEFLEDWHTTLVAIDFDNVRSSSGTLNVAADGSSVSGTRLYGQAKLQVAWMTEEMTRAASLIQTFAPERWTAANPTGPQDFNTWTLTVLLPHIAGTGGVGNSTTRGWSGGNWGVALADAWISIGILNAATASGGVVDQGVAYLNDVLKASIYITGDKGFSGKVPSDTTTNVPYPGFTTANNTSQVPDSAWDTFAEVQSNWVNAWFGTNHPTSTSAVLANLTFPYNGMNFETLRDMSHTMFTMGLAAGAMRSLYYQGNNAFETYYTRMQTSMEFHARAIYEFLTTSGATAENFYPTNWPIASAAGAGNSMFKFGGQGWSSGWEIAHDYYVNIAGYACTNPGDPFYWTHRCLTSTATVISGSPSGAGIVPGNTVKSHFRPSRPSASITIESMTHGDISI